MFMFQDLADLHFIVVTAVFVGTAALIVVLRIIGSNKKFREKMDSKRAEREEKRAKKKRQ